MYQCLSDMKGFNCVRNAAKEMLNSFKQKSYTQKVWYHLDKNYQTTAAFVGETTGSLTEYFSKYCVFTLYFRWTGVCKSPYIQCVITEAYEYVERLISMCDRSQFDIILYLFFSLSCTDWLSYRCFLSHMMFCSFISRMPLAMKNTQ